MHPNMDCYDVARDDKPLKAAPFVLFFSFSGCCLSIR